MSSTSGENVGEDILKQLREVDLQNTLRRFSDAGRETAQLEFKDEDLSEARELDADELASLLLLQINGNADLPPQAFKVTYLQSHQLLQIPAPLGMNPMDPNSGIVPMLTTLNERFWKLATLSYSDIRSLVVPNHDRGAVVEQIDALTVPTPLPQSLSWSDADYYTSVRFENDHPNFQDYVFGRISADLQFNCDVRDFGFLHREDSTASDSFWMDVDRIEITRIKSKLHPFSIQTVAALNLPAVGNEPLAAYVRAYGLSMGLLPDANTKTLREYVFTMQAPSAESQHMISKYKYHRDYGRSLIDSCAHLIALSGLLHLAKDDIYRSGHPNIARISAFYIDALRMGMTTETVAYIARNPEHFIRTGPHPFGLGQTYFLAKLMHRHGRLWPTLAVRLDSSPPPVQRLMIAQATRLEWVGLAAGREVDSLYSYMYDAMTKEVNKVRASPPSYSTLHYLYGVETKLVVDPTLMNQIRALMPAIYGYMTVFPPYDDGPVGLVRANIERDQKELVFCWVRAWENYASSMDDIGLVEFSRHIKELVPGPGVQATGPSVQRC